ncbi:MAG: hypothetical protein QM785_00410 [Pyrinomonadaceae bacterium]
MTHSLTLELPERVYRNLAEKASKNGKRIEDFVAQDIISRDYPKFGDDPLDRLIGTLETGISDWGTGHDKYIGDAVLREIRGEDE